MTEHTGEEERVREALADHFVMWNEGAPGAWVCSCGLRFGFSDSAIGHVAREVVSRIRPAAPSEGGES